MKSILTSTLGLCTALVLIVGCVSQSRVTYNTLAAVQVTTSGAFNSYLDLVVKGQVKTNSVPLISADYNRFQLVWNAAVSVAQWNTNAVASSTVTDASAIVINNIVSAKNGGPQ